MKLNQPSNLLAVAVALPLSSAHYTFSQLVINGNIEGADWQYIREHTRGYMPTFREEAAVSEDFRCNQGATNSGSNTEVFTVHPGDSIALKQAFGGTGMEHPGPAQVYMSQAPDGNVQTYDGSGPWFKVFQELACSNTGAEGFQTTNWCAWGEDRIEFTLPDTVPDGEYLVRAEHIPLHGAHAGSPEFYYACAQVRVEGSSAGGGSIPEPTVEIPGVYGVDDEAILFSVWSGETRYPFIPGPDVIEGGQTRGNADGSAQ